MATPPDAAVASGHILGGDRRYVYAVGSSGGLQLCPELLAEAAPLDPKNPG